MKSLTTILLLACFITSYGQLKSILPIEKKSYRQEKVSYLKNTLLDNYDVNFYFIDLNATNQNKTISGKTSMKAKVVNQPLSELMLQLNSSLIVDSVHLNGMLYPFTFTNSEIHVSVSSTIPIGQYFIADVFYHGTSTGSGIKSSSVLNTRATWTLSESYHAMDWFPCKQELTDKIDSAYIFITCPNTLQVGSNGLLTKIDSLQNNMVCYEWKTYYPLDYYLISFTVSKYQPIIQYAHPQGLQDSILILNYLYNSSNFISHYQDTVARTASFIELLSNLYGLYPYYKEKYGHCTAPIGGGMEHQTMTTLSTFSFELIIHELGHQWFGDYVTCANWQDIWINEGFATYTYYIGLQYLLSQNSADQWMLNTHSDIMSASDGSIYVPFADINDEGRIFDYRLSYEKGAGIIHTLRYIINDDSTFFATLRGFLQQYAFGTATGDDFKNFAQNYTGMDFTQFFDEWYYGEGFPTYSMIWNQQTDSVYFSLSLQSSATTITPFFHLPVEIKFSNGTNDTIVRVFHQYNQQAFACHIPFTVSQITIDPRNYIINDIGSIVTSSKKTESESAFQIYPNPVNDYLHIISINKSATVRIYDFTGKFIKTSEQQEKIDVSDLMPGIYFIEVNGYKQKFIKL